jgi:hypothetical protein
VRDCVRASRVDDDDLFGIGNVYIKRLRIGIIARPSRSTGNGDLRPHRTILDTDDGQGVRAGYSAIADIGDENLSPAMVVGEPIGTVANGNLCHLRVGTRSKDGNRVLGPVGGNDELGFVAHQNTSDTRQLWHRKQVFSGFGIEHIDRAISCVCYIHVSTARVGSRMVEAARTRVFRETDITAKLEEQ